MRTKLSILLKGKSKSIETRKNMKKAQGSDNARNQMAERLKGRVITWADKISVALRGHRTVALQKAWDTRFLKTVAWG